MLGLGRRGESASSSSRGAARWMIVSAAMAALAVAHWSGRWMAATPAEAAGAEPEQAAPAPLRVEFALPTRGTLETDRLSVVFEREVLGLGELEAGSVLSAEPFALEPALGGQWIAVAPNEVAFLLEEPLTAGRRIRALPTPALEALAQGPVAVDCTAEWSTPGLALRETSLRSADDRHLTVELEFNAPVEASALEGALRFRSPQHQAAGRRRPAAPDPEDFLALAPTVLTRSATASHVVRFRRPTGDENSRGSLDLVLAKGLLPAGGDIGLASPAVARVEVPQRFSLLRAYGHSRTEAGTVTIRFDRALSLKQETPAVKVVPEVEPLSVRLRGRELVLEGGFEAGAAYRVGVPGSLLAVDGTSLLEDVEVQVDLPELRPRLSLPFDRGILRPGGTLTLDVDTLNVPAVAVTLERVHSDNYVAHVRGEAARYTSRTLLEEVFSLGSARNRELRSALDLRALIERSRSTGAAALPLAGVYSVEVRSTKNYWVRERALVRVTDLAPTVKRDRDGYHVWLRTLTDSTTLEGARIVGLTLNEQLVTQGRTDVAGYAFLPVDEGHPDGEPYLLVVEHGEGADMDVAYVEVPGATWSVPRALAQGRVRADEGDVFVYPERSLYRPGDRVHLTGISRTARGAVHALPLRLVVERPDGRIVRDEEVQGDPGQGLWHTSLKTDPDARTGLWQVRVEDPSSGAVVGRARFGVEAFLPARLRVAAERAESEDLSRPHVRVNAESLSGSPVEGFRAALAVHWTPRPFASAAHPDFSFERLDDEREASRSELDAKLDAEGIAEAEAPGLDGLAPGVWRGQAEWTVTEPGSRSATAGVAVEVDTARQHLGLRFRGASAETALLVRPDGARVHAGAALLVDAVAVPGATVEPGGALDAWVACERVTRERVLERIGSRLAWKWRDSVEPLWSRPIELGVGGEPESLRVEAPESGLYRLTLQVEGGPRTYVELRSLYRGATLHAAVEGEGLDSVELRPAQASVAPGELLDLTLSAPFDGSALVTVEDERVRWHGRVDVERGSATLQVPMPKDLRGGVLVSAQVTRPLEVARSLSAWAPHRVHGWARVEADREAGAVDVALSAPERVRPGGLARVSVAAEASARVEGRAAPVVHLWAVDEGLRLAGGDRRPRPREHFHAPPAHSTPTTDAWFDLLPDHERPASTARIGGDIGEPGAARRRAPERVSRVPGVVWREAFQLGADGRSTLEVEVPDLVGELTWLAVVVDGDCYGDTQASSTLRGDVGLEVTAPRFAAPGDVFAVPVRLWNPEAQTATTTLAVECEGPARVLAVTDSFVSRPVEASSGASSRVVDLRLEPDARELRWVVVEALEAGRIAARVSLGGAFADGRTLAEEAHFEVPLRTGRPAIVASYVTSVDAADAGGKRVSIDLVSELGLDPADVGQGRVEVSSDLGVSLGPATQYVANYPYGCAEQTSSRILALALQACRLAEIGGSDVDSWRRVRAGVDRLWSMQVRDGGIGYWPGARQSSTWASIVVAEVLGMLAQVESDSSRVDLPEALTLRLAEYLERGVASASSDTERALMVRAATVLGRPMDGWTRRLEEAAHGGSLGTVGRAALAASLAQSGEASRARAILESIGEFDASPASSRHVRYLASGTRALADQLDAWISVDPASPEVARLFLALSAQQSAGRWRNTVDNAAALRALHRARSVLMGGEPAEWQGSLLASGVAVELDSGTTESIGIEGSGTVGLELAGRGRAFVTATVIGRRAADAPREDRGLVVRRRWFDAAGSALEDGAPVAVGDLVHVELVLATDGRDPVDDVVVLDPLAGGFEVENPRLAQSATSWPSAIGGANGDAELGRADRVEFLDDRVLVFTTAKPGLERYRYSMRAVAAGEFERAPVQAEAMYDPTVSSVGGETGSVSVEVPR